MLSYESKAVGTTGRSKGISSISLNRPRRAATVRAFSRRLREELLEPFRLVDGDAVAVDRRNTAGGAGGGFDQLDSLLRPQHAHRRVERVGGHAVGADDGGADPVRQSQARARVDDVRVARAADLDEPSGVAGGGDAGSAEAHVLAGHFFGVLERLD